MLDHASMISLLSGVCVDMHHFLYLEQNRGATVGTYFLLEKSTGPL